MFVIRGANVVEINGVSEGKHTRLTLGDGKNNIVAMYFSNSPETLDVFAGDKVDLLFSIDINQWHDRRTVQLIVRDLKKSNTKEDNKSLLERYNEIRCGATFTESEKIYPDRDDFIYTYKFIQLSGHNGVNTFTHNDLVNKLSSGFDAREIGYIKLKFIIMVFKELNLVNVEELDSDKYRFTIHYSTTKKNLDKSSILRKLRSQMR